MTKGAKIAVMVLVAATSLFSTGCYGAPGTTAYVGIQAPGPWYGYPGSYGRYPGGGGVWVGMPICCDDVDAAEPDDSPQPEASPDAQPEAVKEEESPSR